MPGFHNTMDRRRWLHTAASVGTGALFCSPRCAPADDLEPLSFVVVSDTHLGRNGDSPRKLWEKTAAEIAQRPEELVLHLGDVVNAGDTSQYAESQKRWASYSQEQKEAIKAEGGRITIDMVSEDPNTSPDDPSVQAAIGEYYAYLNKYF